MKGAIENGRCTMEIYNRHLEVWTSAAATVLDWDGRSDVYLLCRTDITPYKRDTAPPDQPTNAYNRPSSGKGRKDVFFPSRPVRRTVFCPITQKNGPNLKK